jgi:hypothetical protein
MAQQYTSLNVTDTLSNSYGQQSTGKHLLLIILFPRLGVRTAMRNASNAAVPKVGCMKSVKVQALA